MKKTLLIAGALLAVSASIASAAGGINLGWADCGAFGTAQKNFACTTNSGANILIVSAITPAPMDQLNGMAAVLDLQSNQATLSQWWSLQTGGCRPTTFAGDFNFLGGPFNCTDPWSGGASGGSNYTFQYGDPSPVPNRARIRTVCAVPSPVSSDGASEYYFVRFTITNGKTVGTGSCAGCADGVCIVLNSVQVTQPATVHQDYTITTPLIRQSVGWQGGASGVGIGPYGGSGCPGATPTRNATWGSVKSLYR